MKRLSILIVAASALALTSAPARAQLPPPPSGGLPAIAGDLLGPTPCCACDPVSGTRCGDLVLEGLGKQVSGCVGVGQVPDTCAGGQLLDAAGPALLDGCGCILGNCAGPLSTDFKPLTTAQCTSEAARACNEGGGAVECACADGKDNDGNGLADCDDPACKDDPACPTCETGKTNCSGTCVDTSTDEANCGSCGHACQTGETCENGTCNEGDQCGTGETRCGDDCVDTSTDEANCGGCDNACESGKTCQGGHCVGCGTGKHECDGACVDLNGDEANCGECGNACDADETCQAGECTGGGTCGVDIPCEDPRCKTNRSGGGDNTNPGGHGNEHGFCNPGHGHGHGGHGH